MLYTIGVFLNILLPVPVLFIHFMSCLAPIPFLDKTPSYLTTLLTYSFVVLCTLVCED
ncbi:hypothetical protein BDV97DRAFT_342022 [Delphinella strobiligena]|nr:hypothetical protein BDV97DRAFT_342022 [Delphinella strobiligena]